MGEESLAAIYRRMLEAAGASGAHVPRRTGPPVHVVSTGEGAPVVHLHGSNTSALSHLMLARPGVRSHLVDRPGFGLSAPDPGRSGTYRDHAVTVVGDVLDALDLRAPLLVGASAGGAMAIWYALTHPDRVAGLVLLGAAPTLPGARPPLPLRVAAARGTGDLLRAARPGRRAIEAMMASMGEGETIGRHPDLLDSLVAGARDPVTSRVNLAELRERVTWTGIRDRVRLTPDELRRIAVPVVLVCGDHDPVLPLARARDATAVIPRAQLEVLPAGHVPQLGHPDRVAALVGEIAQPARG